MSTLTIAALLDLRRQLDLSGQLPPSAGVGCSPGVARSLEHQLVKAGAIEEQHAPVTRIGGFTITPIDGMPENEFVLFRDDDVRMLFLNIVRSAQNHGMAPAMAVKYAREVLEA